MFHARFGLQVFHQCRNAVLVGTGAHAAQHDVVANDMDVTAFHDGFCVAVSLGGTNHFAVKQRMLAVNGFQDGGLTGANLSGHMADHQVVEHGEGGIPHEIKVRQRQEGEIVRISYRKVLLIHTLDQSLGKGRSVERLQVLGKKRDVFGLADAIHQLILDIHVLKDICQKVANLVDMRHFFQYAFEIMMFVCCDGKVKDVAV